jgi:hypothetical protein
MIHAVKSILKHGLYNHSMIGDIINNKHVEAAASSDAATRSATQFKLAVTNALVNLSILVSSAGDASVSSMSTAKSVS